MIKVRDCMLLALFMVSLLTRLGHLECPQTADTAEKRTRADAMPCKHHASSLDRRTYVYRPPKFSCGGRARPDQ